MLFSKEVTETMGPAFYFDRQTHHTDRNQNRLKQLVYLPPAFFARHAMAALQTKPDHMELSHTPHSNFVNSLLSLALELPLYPARLTVRRSGITHKPEPKKAGGSRDERGNKNG